MPARYNGDPTVNSVGEWQDAEGNWNHIPRTCACGNKVVYGDGTNWFCGTCWIKKYFEAKDQT